MALLCQKLCQGYFQCLLPPAPAAVLAAPWGPPLSVVGAAVSAAAAAATAASSAAWRSSLISGSVLMSGYARGSGSASGTSSSLRWRELAGEPKRCRGRDRSRRRCLRLALCRVLFLCGCRGRDWDDGFQPSPLVFWFSDLAAVDQVCHQLSGGDSDGVGGQVDPVARPDARAVHRCQVLG